MRIQNIGGNSTKNSVSYATPTIQTKARIENDEIKVEYILENKKKNRKWLNLTKRAMFIWFCYLLLAQMQKQNIIWIKQIPLFLLLFSLGYMIYMKATDISKFHAAEHKVFNAYVEGFDLTISNILNASRISKFCGINYAISIAVLVYSLFIANFFFRIHMLMSLTVIFLFDMVYSAKGKYRDMLLSPIIFLGNKVQEYLNN